MKRNVSVVLIIVATRRSGPPASRVLLASGTPYIFINVHFLYEMQLLSLPVELLGHIQV